MHSYLLGPLGDFLSILLPNFRFDRLLCIVIWVQHQISMQKICSEIALPKNSSSKEDSI